MGQRDSQFPMRQLESAAVQLLLAVWRSPYDEKTINRLMQASLQRRLMIFSPHWELFGKEYKEISRQIFFDMISLGIGKIGIRGYGRVKLCESWREEF